MKQGKYIVQLTEFSLIEGIDDNSFLKATAKAQSRFWKKQKGFISRELLNSESNQWVNITYWTSKDEAQDAAKAFLTDPSSYPYVLMIAPSSIKELYLHLVLDTMLPRLII